MGYTLVTGAGIRIGKAIAKAFSERGDTVLLHANRSIADAEALAQAIQDKGGSALVIQADLSTQTGLSKLVEETRRHTETLDTLVNNAAIYEAVPFAEVTRSQMEEVFQLNFFAPFFLTQALLPFLEKGVDPNVVNIIDTSVHRPERGYTHYSATKAGLLSLTKSLAVELGDRLRVNGIGPGAIAFPDRFSNEEKSKVLARVPMGRVGAPEDIAKAAVFLAKDAPYVSGELIHVDGGWNAHG